MDREQFKSLSYFSDKELPTKMRKFASKTDSIKNFQRGVLKWNFVCWNIS